MRAKQMTAVALGAVLIIICSWLTVPFAVPFTMQTFAVFTVLILLGGKLGTASIGLFVLMGLVGLPVFSGFRGGVGVLLGPTGGYIVGFVFAGLLYMLLEPAADKNKWLKAAVLAPMVAVQGLIGLFGLLQTAMVATKVIAMAMWAAITSPAFLIGAALAAVVAVVWELTGAWAACKAEASELADDVTGAFTSIRDIAGQTWETIKMAFMSGDLAGAARVGLAALKLAWLTGLQPLKIK